MKIFYYFITLFFVCTCIHAIVYMFNMDSFFEGDLANEKINASIFLNVSIGTIVFLQWGEFLTKCMRDDIFQQNGFKKNLNVEFKKDEIVAFIFFIYFILILISNFIKLFLKLDSFTESIIYAFAVFAAFEKTLDKYQKLK